MMRFFNKSKACAKKRIIDCIKIDRGYKTPDMEKLGDEIGKILSEYFEIEGKVTFEINTEQRNRRYITAGAFIK